MDSVDQIAYEQILRLAHNMVDDVHSYRSVGEYLCANTISLPADVADEVDRHVAEALGWPGPKAWPKGPRDFVLRHKEQYGTGHLALIQLLREYVRTNFDPED